MKVARRRDAGPVHMQQSLPWTAISHKKTILPAGATFKCFVALDSTGRTHETPDRERMVVQQSENTDNERNKSSESDGQVLARGDLIVRADQLAGLLTRRPAVLVAKTGDPIRPFQQGIYRAFKEIARPGVNARQLSKAIWRYTQESGYLLALSRSGAMRHDLDGAPVEPVTDEIRHEATEKFRRQLRRPRKSKGN